MPEQTRLSGILGPFRLIWPSIKFHYAALKQALHSDGLTALLHPLEVHDAALAKLFITTSPGFIAYEDSTSVPTLVRSAHGKILELGPGPGNQIHRYDLSRVEFIYAIEPNAQYGNNIASKVTKLDLQDKYKLLACGIEDSDVLRGEGITEGSLDTVLSIQVLCSVRDAKSVMREVWKLLRPGGSFIFWEHERSRDVGTAVAQACWNPAWSALVGCCLNREIMKEILAAGEWENPGEFVVAEDPFSCLPRVWGVLRKKG